MPHVGAVSAYSLLQGVSMWKWLITFFTVISFTACTTFQPMAGVTGQNVRENIQAGDRVRLVTSDQQVYELKVDQVKDDMLYGTAPDGKHQQVLLGTIVSIEKRVASGATTIWVVLGILGLVTIIAAVSDGGGGSGGGEGY